MLDHARTVGGPALRELTFHQRAALLKQLGLRLMAQKDEFYELSTAPARPTATTRSTSTAASARCSRTPARAGASCPTTRSTSTAPRSRWAGAARSSASTSTPDARRRRPDQRLQLPGLGDAREVRAGVPGRRADRRQAGQPDRLRDRARRPADGRVRAAARGLGAADRRQRHRPARPPRPARTWCCSPARPRPPASCAATRPSWPTRCASTPRPTRSTARCSARTPGPGLRSSTCSSAARRRDDRQGRPAVHGHPPRAGAPRSSSTTSSRRSASGWPRSSSAIPAPTA